MLEEIIEVVTDVAQKVIMPRYLQVGREMKSDGSFFTEADIAAQTALLEALQKIRPAPAMGEEMSHYP